jgi:hypothetical protein
MVILIKKRWHKKYIFNIGLLFLIKNNTILINILIRTTIIYETLEFSFNYLRTLCFLNLTNKHHTIPVQLIILFILYAIRYIQ